MRIAVISDIHGNLSALEAVMEDIGKRKADMIVCLGDLIGKGPSTKEVIDICRNECDVIVKGNWEDFICDKYFKLKNNDFTEIGEKTLWYINSMTPEQATEEAAKRIKQLFEQYQK